MIRPTNTANLCVIGRTSSRRGLTLLEMMLALTITAMVALAIAGMMGAVSAGLANRADARTLMIAGHAAQIRLGTYITPARCILDADGQRLVVWFNDDREGDTVHASEMRWLMYDDDRSVLEMHYVDFPDSWSELERDRRDREYSRDADWFDVLDYYDSQNWISTTVLIDELVDLRFSLPDDSPINARQVITHLTFDGVGTQQDVAVSSTIRRHGQPDSF